MSTGAVFLMISNDGKQDRMIMASEMLKNRLETISAKRRADPSISDDTPTLLDIERTHVLFMNAHYKPFVAMAYEYNKVNASGAAQLGSTVQFSIPQFGDFFSDMLVYVQLDAPTLTHSHTGADAPTVRWCDYPGERFIKKASFDVNGNPLESYTCDQTALHRKFHVQPNKKLAWDRCMGQQVARKAYLSPDTATAPDSHQVWLDVTDGPQTPKPQAQSLELLIPLLFWCNLDPRLAVPSVAIPFGQRFINLELATKDELVGYQTRGAGTSGITLDTPNVRTISLYINNIFVNPEIHAIFIKRIGFTLIRVRRLHTSATQLSENEILLQQLKWPIEHMRVALRPTENKTSLANWHKCAKINQSTLSLPNVLASGTAVTVAALNTATPVTGVEASCVVENQVATMDKITISAHGVPLYNDIPAKFFRDYVPLTYGGVNVCSSEDEGAYLITFNLYPGTYQPSGHLNVSRARELYFKYNSSVVGPSTPAELLVDASAINFLLITDGSAVLRYTT